MNMQLSYILRDWRWLVPLVLGVGIGGFALQGYLISDRSPEPVQTGSITNEKKPAITVTTVAQRTIRQTLTVTGSLIARDEIMVSAQIDNVRLEQYFVDVGDHVVGGQVLARLDSALLENRLAQNALEIAKAQATVKQTEAAIVELEATLVEVEQAAERARKLKQTGAVSSETLQSRETSLAVTRARLTGQRENLRFAEASKGYAVAQRDEIILSISRAIVRAPASGVVSTRTAKAGQLVGTATAPLFHIIRDGAIELEADIVDSRLDALAVGQNVVLTLDGRQPINGKIRLMAPSIDPVTRLGKIRIALDPGQGLRPGRFVTATIDVKTQDSIVVPSTAVFFSTEGPRVQVVSEDRVKNRPVIAGMRDATGTEILGGLATGESIVVKAGGFLRDGDLITPVSAQKAEAKTTAVSQTEIN